MMNSYLVSCSISEIPDALTREHEELRNALVEAAMKPGPIGIAAKRVAHIYLPHFVKEEQMIFSAFALLQDLAAQRVLPEMAPVEPMIALFSSQHHALLHQHESINSAVEQLLQEATKENDTEVADLVRRLRSHEKTEDVIMYPTVLMIGKSLRAALEKKQPEASLNSRNPREGSTSEPPSILELN